MAATSGDALAQRGGDDTVSAPAWMSGGPSTTTVTETRTTTRRAAPSIDTTTSVTRVTEPRRPRRAVNTSTVIEDFDMPSRPARRATTATRSRRGTTTVTTTVSSRPAQRRVRVAALTSTDFQTYDVPTRPATRRSSTASTGRVGLPSIRAPRPSLTGGGIAWRANSGCLAGNLRSIVASVAASYGSVTVNSTCRSRTHNRRVGGASRSWHLTGNAVDFRVHGGNLMRLSAYLRSNVGGFKHYGGGRYHIDNGPKRSF